ncbi:DUF1850 domain-containing protein [Anaeroselena agilis]|uniref:DUF1850 domain-containing protein n=1 Tax=Anaeroselena agilis TaxID=3063788 RepID=A0ABU3NY83_9FIRM|nr:DUF1850 domain-containing protein [Selenomonadales bacterium 4137-cl]
MFERMKGRLAGIRTTTLLGVSCLVAGLIVGGLFLATRLCMFIETDQGKTETILVSKGDTFSLKYTHSVQKTPVAENFVIAAADELILESTVYQTYGVGLPFLPGEGKFIRQGNDFIITGMNRRFDKVSVHAGPIAGLVLEVHNRVVPLYAFHKGGAFVTIRVKPYYYRWLRND